MMNNKRNYVLDLWRFIFCLCIILLHTGAELGIRILGAGYLGVEFFLIISGYYLASSCQKIMPTGRQNHKERFTCFVNLIWKRFKRLYPLYILSFFSILISQGILEQKNIGEIIHILKNYIGEVFMVQCTGLLGGGLNYPDWYVSAIFLSTIILCIPLLVCGRKTGAVFIGFTSIFLYVYFYRLIGKIDIIVSYYALLRAIAGMGIGIICFALVSLVHKRWIISYKMQKLFNIFGNLMLFLVVIYMRIGRRGKVDFVVIAFMAFSIVFIMLGQSFSSDKVKKLFQLLGKISFPLYLFQLLFISLIKLFC